MIKPICETFMAERNRNDPDNYDSFEIQRTVGNDRVFFKNGPPIYILLKDRTPNGMAETLRWMASEIEKIEG